MFPAGLVDVAQESRDAWKVATPVAEVDHEGRREIAMPLEFLQNSGVTAISSKFLNFVLAKSVLDLLDGPTYEVGIRSLEHGSKTGKDSDIGKPFSRIIKDRYLESSKKRRGSGNEWSQR
jgi:hypothetical protein